MNNLIFYYLLLILVLFGANFPLVSNFKKSSKTILYSVIYSIILFVLSIILVNFHLDLIGNNIEYIFFFIGVLIFILTLYSLYKKDLQFISSVGFVLSSFIMILAILLSSTYNLDVSFILLIILVVFSLLSYKLSYYSNFNGKVSEFLILESILFMILGLTYPFVKILNYSDFMPFTILTPTYQVIILVIFIIALVVVGVLVNDYRK